MLYALLLLLAFLNAMDTMDDPEENFKMKQLPNTMWEDDSEITDMWVKYFPESGTWDNKELVFGKLEIDHDESELREGEPSFVYEGALKDYYPHGYGILTVNGYPPFFEFSRYEGHFQTGKFHGKGKLINDNEQVAFEGEFKNNSPQRGKIFYDHGRVYDGEVKNDLPHGIGKMMDSDGKTIFEGTWLLGVKDHGLVRFSSPSGTRTYEGRFWNNEAADGILRDENNVKYYQGKVNKDFEPNGEGMLTVRDTNRRIKGFFENGQLRQMEIDGQKYVGSTVDFKPHGEGYLYDKKTDTLWQGTFVNGEKLEGEEKEPCTICFCHMFPNEVIRTAGLPPRCTHTFHLACIKKFLETKSEYCNDTNKKCPLCRVYIAEYDHLN